MFSGQMDLLKRLPLPEGGMKIPVSRGYAFPSRGTQTAKFIVVHEAGCPSMSGAVSSLLKKGLGVHSAVSDSRAEVRFFNHPRDVLWHAGPLNDGSVGIEYVFSPVATHPSNKGRPVIKAGWVWKGGSYPNPLGLFALPTLNGLEALYTLVCTYADALSVKLVCPDEPMGAKLSAAALKQKYTLVCHGREPSSTHTDGWFQERYIKYRLAGILPQAAIDKIVAENGGLVKG